MEPKDKYLNDLRKNRELRDLKRIMRQVSDTLERTKIGEYIWLLNNPKRLIFLNFLSGIFRGIGLAVGFTLLGALLIYLLTRNFLLNLPLIGSFFGELVWIIQQYLSTRP